MSEQRQDSPLNGEIPTSGGGSACPLRIGVYICRCGGNISDVVDVEQVAAAARRADGVAVAKVHTFMCSDPGQRAIEEDIRQERLDRVVVASCSPFLHEATFRGAVRRGGLNPYLYEHANIREQCSWAHRHDPAGATAKAERLIAAAVGKARFARPLEPIRLPNRRQALVIGGGIAGLKVAAELAGRGIPVLLVERSDRLGGHLNQWGRVFPTEQLAEDIVAQLKRAVRANPLVEVLLECEVTALSGFVGNFQAHLEPGGREGRGRDVTVGVVIVAMGFKPYAPREAEFLFHQHPGVLTMPEFIRVMQETGPQAKELRYAGRLVRRVAFLHCVGSRQLDGVHEPQPDGRLNAYCSRVCCTTTLQQALALRRRFPEVDVFDLHQDIRTYGRGHEDYYADASKAGVTFFRYHGDEPPQAAIGPAGRDGTASVRLTVKDYLTWGEEVSLSVDLLVLAVGMTPGDVTRVADSLKLPVGEDRFLQEVHPKLRPVEVAVNGVLLAGTAQGPMNITETLAAAGAAAAKASALLLRDAVELDPYVATVDRTRCEGAGECIRACAYDGALRWVDTPADNGASPGRRAEVNPGLCVGCGACVAACPHHAIDLNGWRLDQFDAMVDGLVTGLPADEATSVTLQPA